MKLRTVLPMLAVATFALAACASKVDYAKFHEKAVEAGKKEAGYKKFTIKGYEKGSYGVVSIDVKFNHTFEKDGNSWKLVKGEDDLTIKAAILEAVALHAEDIPEADKYEYYAGSTFKVVYKDGDDEATDTYDKFGYPTSSKGKVSGFEADIKISWSK